MNLEQIPENSLGKEYVEHEIFEYIIDSAEFYDFNHFGRLLTVIRIK